MLYRVNINLAFASESDAKALMEMVKTYTPKATSINEDKANPEISYAELHTCNHDTNGACVVQERQEVKLGSVVDIVKVKEK